MIGALLLAANTACAYEWCAKAKPDITACKCAHTDDDRATVRVRRGDRVIHESDHDTVIASDPGIGIVRLDLDGDGKREIIVSTSLGMSNGMGIEYWTLIILDGRTDRAVQLDVEEYGDGTFRREPDGRYTVLATAWEEIDGKHLYFVARPYAYHEGKLTPQKWRGMWVRRYLFSFEHERGWGPCALKIGSCTALWLRKAKVVKWMEPEKR